MDDQQKQALAWAVTLAEDSVESACRWVYSRQVDRFETRRSGSRDEALRAALTKYIQLQKLRELAGEFEREDYDMGPLKVASAWQELELYYLGQSGYAAKNAAAICAERYARERALVAPDQIVHLDDYRAEVLAEREQETS